MDPKGKFPFLSQRWQRQGPEPPPMPSSGT
jgi:hypothetical protein